MESRKKKKPGRKVVVLGHLEAREKAGRGSGVMSWDGVSAQFKDERGESLSRERERVLRSLKSGGKWVTKRLSPRVMVTKFEPEETPTQEIRRRERIEELEIRLNVAMDISNDYKDKWQRALEEIKRLEIKIARLKAMNAGTRMDVMVRR